MIQLILEPNLGEATFSNNILLNGVVALSETPSTSADVYWRWEDEDDMKPEFLGRVTAGSSLRVPFEMKGRDIRLFLVSVTSDGLRSVQRIEEAVQTVFSAPARVYSGEVNVEADEDLDPFDLVHIFSDGGTAKARKASAFDDSRPARAFVTEGATGDSLVSGSTVRLFFGGNIITTTGRTPGAVQYLEYNGAMSEMPPSSFGNIVQVIGTAISPTEVIFEPDEPQP